ncbi:hypothetical protein [Mangrovimonas xylaniphaga]|uniref:hypothetical protein n=1 Tax=Mangrovimonas xylaniphaga TaxID=1645915 RepID=UPI0006B56209|nr:hypothetical protein [Mangrovimonas xylaniphaga]
MKKVLLLFTIFASLLACSNDDDSSTPSNNIPDDLPDVSQVTFTSPTTITNNYFGPQTTGTIYVYEAGDIGEEPEEEIRIEIRTNTKTVMGVTCFIQHDVVYKDGILIEDTDDWIAEDDNGNLWYFGESVKNYDDDGDFEDNDGSWEAGIDDALPGYWLPIAPYVGLTYHQEYWEDEAEDYAEVLSTNETVTIDLGTYQNCLMTKDENPFETGEYEIKYYAPDIGFIKEEKYVNGALVEMEQLVEIIE